AKCLARSRRCADGKHWPVRVWHRRGVVALPGQKATRLRFAFTPEQWGPKTAGRKHRSGWLFLEEERRVEDFPARKWVPIWLQGCHAVNSSARNLPVYDAWHAATCSGVPQAISWPPL